MQGVAGERLSRPANVNDGWRADGPAFASVGAKQTLAR